MVIIRDLVTGEVIGKEASARYVPTRKLRAAHEQALCDKQMGIESTPEPTPEARAEAQFEDRFIRIMNSNA